MLLFLMRRYSSPPPLPEAVRADERRQYPMELLAAALFLSGWCVLRLFVSRDTSHGVDAPMAASCLMGGVFTVAHCLRSLRASQPKACRDGD